ncbi:ladderlectin-like [Misgurnus anguillicaudatus]|uniref:ladderlectin-like n=1 Tax=Misgurnus anguillicaudatus TaxID=75329 RepID=UPI003CCF2A55
MAVMRALVLLFLVFSVENAAAEDCLFGWTPFGVECYKFFPNSVNWPTAEKNCEALDANLASVRNKVLNDFLLSLIPAGTQSGTWIAGQDGEVDGQWLWSDGSEFDYVNWCANEPNNAGGPENCIVINVGSNHCWNDMACSLTTSYICAQPMKS